MTEDTKLIKRVLIIAGVILVAVCIIKLSLPSVSVVFPPPAAETIKIDGGEETIFKDCNFMEDLVNSRYKDVPVLADSVPIKDIQFEIPPTFEDLLDAIEWVESRGDANAVGDWIEMCLGTAPLVNRGVIGEGVRLTKIEMRDGKVYRCDAQAVGAYQLHKKYVDDVNRIVGQNIYEYKDRWDKEISREMVKQYVTWYVIWAKNSPCSPSRGEITNFNEYAARIHNGGPDGWKKKSTEEYWQLIKARMESVK